MSIDPPTGRRKSRRLRGFDYSLAGAYFISLCVQDRRLLFGEVLNGAMHPNDAGSMVSQWWAELESKFPLVQADEHIVMPNHFHGIVILWPLDSDIVGGHLCVAPLRHTENAGASRPDGTRGPGGRHIGPPLQGPPSETTTRKQAGPPSLRPTLPRIVQWLKTMTTNDYVKEVRAHGWPRFEGRLWQRDYHDRVVRDDEGLNDYRRYIRENPARWEADEENPVPFGLPARWGGGRKSGRARDKKKEEGPHAGGPLQ